MDMQYLLEHEALVFHGQGDKVMLAIVPSIVEQYT